MERVNYSPVKKAVAKAPDAGCLTVGASGSVIVNVGPSPGSFVRAAALDADFYYAVATAVWRYRLAPNGIVI